MMNPILGIEPSAGSKAPPLSTGIQNKSNSSNGFSDYMAAEARRGTGTGNTSELDGESAVPDAETEDSGTPSAIESESGIAPGESAKTVETGEGATTEETLSADSSIETEPGPAALDQAAVDAKVLDGSEPADTAQMGSGGQGGGAVQTADNADAVKDARGKGAAGFAAAKEASTAAALPGSDQRNEAQGVVLDRGTPSAEGGSPKERPLGDAPKQSFVARTVAGQGIARAGTNGQNVQAQSVQTQPEAVSENTEVAPEAAAAKRSAAAAGAFSGGNVQPETAGQTVPGSKGGRSAARNSADPEADKAVSGFPNERAVEQVAARQPVGVTRAVAAGSQGAAQALAARQQASSDGAGKAESGTDRLVVSEEFSADALVERKPSSGAVRTGDIQSVQVPQAAQQAATMFQPLLAGGLVETASEANPLSLVLGLTGETPGLGQLLTEASFGTPAAHRPEMPRMIASQIAEAFAAKGEQKVEVSLNPQELGHVKMRVVTSETGITMIIQTERPETGDLMRRHINELAEEFRRMGYEDISFEFSGGQADEGGHGDGDEDGSGQSGRMENSQSGPEADGEQAKQNLRLGAAGVDMRV